MVRLGQPAADLRRDRQRPEHRPCGDGAGGEAAERPRGDLLQAEHGGGVRGRERDHLVEGRPRLHRDRVAVVEVPAAHEHAITLLRVRVLLADPPAFTPWYDHELAAALARAGVDVELATSRFRFGELPPPDGYARSERFYPLSSRLFGRSRLRLPLKAAEHAPVMWSLARARADVLHLQWLALPQADVRLRFRSPSVFTAHDLLPRRTASREGLWRRLLRRFDRVVVHSERGRDALGALGIEARVIPHPVYPSGAVRGDDGATVLALGVIRPYKGLPDAVAATRALGDVRLLVAGDPAMPLDGLRAEPHVDWRLGYLPQSELDRALSESTVAGFPSPPGPHPAGR